MKTVKYLAYTLVMMLVVGSLMIAPLEVTSNGWSVWPIVVIVLGIPLAIFHGLIGRSWYLGLYTELMLNIEESRAKIRREYIECIQELAENMTPDQREQFYDDVLGLNQFNS